MKKAYFLIVVTALALLFSGSMALAVDPAQKSVLDGLNVTAGQADITKTNTDDTPSVALGSFLGGAINYGFAVVGVIFITIIMIGGLLWMQAKGDVAKIDKAKTFILNGIFGLMVIAFSYALVFVILNSVGGSAGL